MEAATSRMAATSSISTSVCPCSCLMACNGLVMAEGAGRGRREGTPPPSASVRRGLGGGGLAGGEERLQLVEVLLAHALDVHELLHALEAARLLAVLHDARGQ